MSNNKDFKVKNGIQPTSYQESLGTVTEININARYDLTTASYNSVSFSVTSQEGSPLSVAFNNDGTKMYVVGFANDTVYQYSLSTAFDVSTASYDSVSFSVATQDLVPSQVIFNNNGTKMYMVGQTNDSIYQYSLSTAFDVSTASYDSVSFSFSSQEAVPGTIAFNNDGTKLYMMGNAQHKVFQYSLSTAYDISTISYDSVSFSVIGQDEFTASITFNNDGTKMYMLGRVNNRIFQYSLSTAFVLSTASYDNVSFSVASEDTQPRSIIFNNDGTKLYLIGTQNDSIYEYTTGYDLNTNTIDLSTGNVFQIAPTSDIQVGLSNPAASGTISQATVLLSATDGPGYDLANGYYENKSFDVSNELPSVSDVTFKPDGTKMYVIGVGNDTVYQYSLSTAYEITTADYDEKFKDVSAEDILPRNVKFNNDGSKMYIIGTDTDTLYQYSLTTDYDVSTASYDSVSRTLGSEDISPNGFNFNNDGTKLFVAGDENNAIFQYNLTTAFDISTATYSTNSFTLTTIASPRSLVFNDDGTKMYVCGYGSDIHEYIFTTAFDISTASFNNVTLDTSGVTGTITGLAISSNGKKLYVTNFSTDLVYQFSIAGSYTITYSSAIEFHGGTAPDSPAAGETDVLTFSTRDGGTTYHATQAIDGAI